MVSKTKTILYLKHKTKKQNEKSKRCLLQDWSGLLHKAVIYIYSYKL